MGLLDASYSAVNTKKPRKSDRILPGEELNVRGLLDAATNVPIAGDALSGVLAAYDAAKGDYGSAAMNALGVLPFVSAGMVKGTGKIADALNAKHGEKLDAYLSEGSKGINLSKIVVPKESRNSGVGTEFMNDLVSMADKEGKTLTLTPSSDFGGSKARLQEFYKRFGFVPNKGRTKDFEISEAMYRNPVEQPKIESGLLDDVRPMTEYEKRHEIARQNAVKMLGLPENNTAMDRARAMGAVDFYHGTTADVPAFDLKYYGSDGVAYKTPAVFGSSDTVLSSDYALNKFDREISDAMRNLEAHKRLNPGVYDDTYEKLRSDVSGAFKSVSSDGRQETGGGANVMPLMAIGNFKNVDANGARFMQAIPENLSLAKADGFDGVKFSNVIDNASPATDYPSNVYAVFNPANIRSRFAAFDPARRHEADLLGYADPRLLGLIGGGGLLGLGAYKANQE